LIVADTNLIAYLFLTGDLTEQAEKVFCQDSDWAAPILWRSEFRNVLALYLHKGLISLETASLIMDEAMQLFRGCEYEVNSYKVLDLVSRSLCSAYDCEFVALAQDLGIGLVTNDKKILDQFPETVIPIERFLIE
jgi:predicted nucleic acid-binding protein